MALKPQSSVFYFLFTICYLLFCSCGIEDYPFINPIHDGNIIREFTSRAVIRIQSDSPGTTFTNFAVFYKIYVSDILLPSTTSTSSYASINSALVSDYNTFSGYINSTTQVNVDMNKLFSDRGYKYLGLENGNISNVLSPSSLGQSLTFDFSSSKMPTLTLGNSTHVLWRSDGGGLFSPRPDRYFRNNGELWNPANITNQINADVVNKADLADGDMRYTYAAMFIVAVGINPASYSNIYRTPSLIHVFLLPN
jgi:hypothetical protein